MGLLLRCVPVGDFDVHRSQSDTHVGVRSVSLAGLPCRDSVADDQFGRSAFEKDDIQVLAGLAGPLSQPKADDGPALLEHERPLAVPKEGAMGRLVSAKGAAVV